MGDWWDTGRMASDETVNIPYADKTLVSGEGGFWKVRGWDKQGKVSDWSLPAHWSMGLLQPTDWQGRWIGWDRGERTNDFGGASWGAFPEGNPAESAPAGTVVKLRHAETLKPDGTLFTANLRTAKAADVKSAKMDGDRAGLEIGSGDYHFGSSR